MMVTRSLEECCVVELRRYTLRPGALGDLLAVFDGALIEPQEECGMAIAGTFADDRAPDTFTWLRGFADHDARVGALKAFYGGPVWAEHAARANATMRDTDDVLVLKSLDPSWEPAPAVPRGRPGDGPRAERALIGVYGLGGVEDPADGERWFATTAVPALQDTLGVRVAAWRSDPTPNRFPRLPVRDDRVLVSLAVFADARARDDAAARLETSPIQRELERRTSRRQLLRLTPTPRSAHPVAEAARSGPTETTPEAGR